MGSCPDTDIDPQFTSSSRSLHWSELSVIRKLLYTGMFVKICYDKDRMESLQKLHSSKVLLT